MIVPANFYADAKAIAAAHGLTLDELRQPSNNRSMVRIRREVAVALREAGASYKDVGIVLARDHTTIISLVKKKAKGVTENVRSNVEGSPEPVQEKKSA